MGGDSPPAAGKSFTRAFEFFLPTLAKPKARNNVEPHRVRYASRGKISRLGKKLPIAFLYNSPRHRSLQINAIQQSLSVDTDLTG